MNRWLLYLATLLALLVPSLTPLNADTPKNTLERARAGKKIKPELIKTKDGKDVEWIDSGLTEKDIPKPLRKIRELEMQNSQRSSPVFASVDTSVLGPYDPQKGNVVYAPFIPIPREYFDEYLKEKDMPKDLERTLFFEHGGKEYARFFIHPTMTEKYRGMIDKWGIVRDEYVGFFSASPRSMYVWNPGDPNMPPFVAKTSLHKEIDQSLRINFPPKAARSYYVNDVMRNIPQDVKDAHGFEIMPEYAQLLPARKATSTIYRAIPEEMLDGNRWVPGFTITTGVNGEPSIVEKVAKSGRGDKLENAAEILRPLMHASAYLMFEEGAKGELHEQNVLFEMKNGKFTARVMLKDLDGFRIDSEIRLRRGKSIEGLRHIFKPFIYSKHAKASGWGNTEGESFDQEAYYYFIKNTFGYSFCKVLKCTKEQHEKFNAMLDRVMAEETERVTGLPVNPKTLAVDSWLETGGGLTNVNRRIHENLNESVNKGQVHPKWLDPKAQKILKAEYSRLRGKKRVTATLADLNSARIYFIPHPDAIEARAVDPKSSHETSIGIASLYPEGHPQTKKFRAGIAKLGLPRDFRLDAIDPNCVRHWGRFF